MRDNVIEKEGRNFKLSEKRSVLALGVKIAGFNVYEHENKS